MHGSAIQWGKSLRVGRNWRIDDPGSFQETVDSCKRHLIIVFLSKHFVEVIAYLFGVCYVFHSDIDAIYINWFDDMFRTNRGREETFASV